MYLKKFELYFYDSEKKIVYLETMNKVHTHPINLRQTSKSRNVGADIRIEMSIIFFVFEEHDR